MEIGLTAKVSPEIDEKESDRQASKLQEKMQESVENLETGDSLEDTLEQVEDMEERLEDAQESMEAMEEAVPDGGMRTGGATGGGEDGPNTLSGIATKKGREHVKGKVGGGEALAKAADNSKELGQVSSKLGGLKKTLIRGAGAIAVIGFAALALGKIWDGIKSMAKHSPLLAQVLDMFGLAMSLFFRPFASMLGRFLLPIVAGILRLAANFNKVFGERGLLGALAWLAKTIIVGIIEGFWGLIKWAVFELPMILLENLPKILAGAVMAAMAVVLAPFAGLLSLIVGGVLVLAGLFGKTSEVFDFMVDLVFGLYNLLRWAFDTVIGLIVGGLMWVLNNIGDILWLLALPLILFASLAITFIDWLWDKLKSVFDWFKDPSLEDVIDLGADAGELAWDAIQWTGEIAWDAIQWGAEIAWDAIQWGGEIAWDIIQWGGEIAWSIIQWHKEIAWSAIQWGGEIAWDIIQWGGEIAWDAIQWGAEIAWDAIQWGGEIAWSAIAWGKSIAWDAIQWGGEISWDAIQWTGEIAWDIIQWTGEIAWSIIQWHKKIAWSAIQWGGEIAWDIIEWTGAIELGKWMFEGFIDITEFILDDGETPDTSDTDVPDASERVGYESFNQDQDNSHQALLQSGGIATGPTDAIIGEGTESEAVLPLSKLENMINTGGSISGRELEDSLRSALGDQLDNINTNVQDLVRQIRRQGFSDPITITADGKVLAEVSEDGRDKYKRSREINR